MDSLREAFGKYLVEIADDYPEMVVLDADVAGGTGAHYFRDAYPARFFQFGIAEQNMMAAAGGMAAVGLTPIVTGMATFLLRGLEMARLSIAYSNRNVKVFGSHPGLDAGPDGASAQCVEDLAAWSAIPGSVVLVPADVVEMREAVDAALGHYGLVYVRTGRSAVGTVNPLWPRVPRKKMRIGNARVWREGEQVSIFACGIQLKRAMDAQELLYQRGIDAEIVNMPSIKPFDEWTAKQSLEKTACCVVTQDHSIYGGLCDRVLAAIAREGLSVPVECCALRDTFGESGPSDETAEKYGIGPVALAAAAERAVRRKRDGS